MVKNSLCQPSGAETTEAATQNTVRTNTKGDDDGLACDGTGQGVSFTEDWDGPLQSKSLTKIFAIPDDVGDPDVL